MLDKAKPYIILALMSLSIVVATVIWTRNNHRYQSALRDAEAARLILQNQLVEEQASRKQVQGQVNDLLDHNAALREAYEEVSKKAPVEVASVSQLDTGPLKVQAPPRPRPSAPVGVTTEDPGENPPPSPGSLCVLENGNEVGVRVDVLELQTGAGNTIITGTAEVWRVNPTPPLFLAGGKFQSKLSVSMQRDAPAPKRWGLLLLGGCGTPGCGPGVGVLFPPFRVPLVGWSAEPFLGGLALPAAPVVVGGVGTRW